jgi:hypothetical protein
MLSSQPPAVQQALDRLSKRDQQALLRTIDLFLSKASG